MVWNFYSLLLLVSAVVWHSCTLFDRRTCSWESGPTRVEILDDWPPLPKRIRTYIHKGLKKLVLRAYRQSKSLFTIADKNALVSSRTYFATYFSRGL